MENWFVIDNILSENIFCSVPGLSFQLFTAKLIFACFQPFLLGEKNENVLFLKTNDYNKTFCKKWFCIRSC